MFVDIVFKDGKYSHFVTDDIHATSDNFYLLDKKTNRIFHISFSAIDYWIIREDEK